MSFKCPIEECDRLLSSRSNLTRHVRVYHFKIKRFQCALCLKWVSSSQNLRKHQRYHERINQGDGIDCSSFQQAPLDIPKLTDLLKTSTGCLESPRQETNA
jgi:hypothetical protein